MTAPASLASLMWSVSVPPPGQLGERELAVGAEAGLGRDGGRLGDQRVHHVVGVEVGVQDQVGGVADLGDPAERGVDGLGVGVERAGGVEVARGARDGDGEDGRARPGPGGAGAELGADRRCPPCRWRRPRPSARRRRRPGPACRSAAAATAALRARTVATTRSLAGPSAVTPVCSAAREVDLRLLRVVVGAPGEHRRDQQDDPEHGELARDAQAREQRAEGIEEPDGRSHGRPGIDRSRRKLEWLHA